MKTNDACMNKERKDGFWKLETLFDYWGKPYQRQTYIEDTSSKLCRSDQDIYKIYQCHGCRQQQDVDYFRQQGWI